MAEPEEKSLSLKKWWDEATTQKLISELRENYSLYKSGQIRKKTLWQKIADALNESNPNGCGLSAEQVENKYKSLLRSYRNSYGVKSRAAGKFFKYENELQEIFMLDMKSENKTLIENEEEPVEYIMEQNTQDSDEVQEETENNSNIFEEVLIEEPAPIRTNYVRKQIPRVKYRVISKKTKTSVDVLLEIKELMKKVELRNQIRHEQNLKIAMERNKILKRKNELMEEMLKNNISTL